MLKMDKSIKKYLPHTICKKCMSELKYLAIPSIIGRTDHAVRFKIIAFIGFFLKKCIFIVKKNYYNIIVIYSLSILNNK